MLTGKTIVIGVCGGIAVYKTVEVASRLKKMGARVKVIMTQNAAEFVSPLTFQTITGQKVAMDMFQQPEEWNIAHIDLAEESDLILVAPATYNIIGKIASGIADDLLTTTIAASRAPVVFVPAMNSNMYNNPVFQSNLKSLQELGYEFIEPEVGELACGTKGPGRFPHAQRVVEEVVRALYRKDLAGMRLLVTAGPTREEIDPVRMITNASTGKMGYAVALAALRRGAQVTLVSGPTHVEPPQGLQEFVKVESTQEMLEEVVKRCKKQDAIIKAAAPLDYRPVQSFDQKVKKESQKEINLELVRNADILELIGKEKGDRILVGFAAETQNLISNAKKKLARKHLDFIVANDITGEEAGFEKDTNKAILVFPEREEKLPVLSKLELSHRILDEIQKLRREIK